jgi:hypothetical protein
MACPAEGLVKESAQLEVCSAGGSDCERQGPAEADLQRDAEWLREVTEILPNSEQRKLSEGVSKVLQADLKGGGDSATHPSEAGIDGISALVMKRPGSTPQEQTRHLNMTADRANLSRLLNALTDPSAAVRKKSLLQLRELFLKEGQIELQFGRDELQVFAESQVLKPLLRRFGDSSSACRELALDLTVG